MLESSAIGEALFQREPRPTSCPAHETPFLAAAEMYGHQVKPDLHTEAQYRPSYAFGKGNVPVNFARLMLKKAFTFRTLASWVSKRRVTSK